MKFLILILGISLLLAGCSKTPAEKVAKAILENNINELDMALREKPLLKNFKDKHGRTIEDLLKLSPNPRRDELIGKYIVNNAFEFAKTTDKEAALKIYERGIYTGVLSPKDALNPTVLHMCINNKNLAGVEILLSNKDISPTISHSKWYSPLECALLQESVAMIQLLRKYGANRYSYDDILRYFAREGREKRLGSFVKFMITQGYTTAQKTYNQSKDYWSKKHELELCKALAVDKSFSFDELIKTKFDMASLSLESIDGKILESIDGEILAYLVQINRTGKYDLKTIWEKATHDVHIRFFDTLSKTRNQKLPSEYLWNIAMKKMKDAKYKYDFMGHFAYLAYTDCPFPKAFYDVQEGGDVIHCIYSGLKDTMELLGDKDTKITFARKRDVFPAVKKKFALAKAQSEKAEKAYFDAMNEELSKHKKVKQQKSGK